MDDDDTDADATPQRRDAARVIVLDGEHRVLLFKVASLDGARPPLWLTPGGGIEDGESPLDAAVRELREETGLECAPGELVGPVAHTEGEWAFRGTPLVSEEWFYALRSDGVDVRADGWTDLERELHLGWQWWSVDELDTTDEVVLPVGLAELVRVLDGAWHPAREPVELPWRAE